MITYKQIMKLKDENIKAGKSYLECSYGYCKALLEGIEAVENTRKDKTMTVEFNGTIGDAIRNCCHGIAYPEALIQALEALGLIKFKEEKKEDKPVFEVKYPSGVHTYKIWADGRIEGFNEATLIVNRIPELLAKSK